MKVPDLKYERITIEHITEELKRVTAAVKSAATADDVLKARERYVSLYEEFTTAARLSEMRYTLNTADEFYLKEKEYYDEVMPEVESLMLEYANAMLESPFRAELEKKTSPLVFKSFEIYKKAMSPAIIGDMVEENKLTTQYSNLMSSLKFEFRGETMPLTLLRKYMKDDDRKTRREAYEVLGAGLMDVSETLDGLFDKLVKVRDRMAKKMGYENYIELGYHRLGRLSFDGKMVGKFRQNVLEFIVPAVARLKKENAKRMGIDKFMLYDNDVSVPGGDPKPVLDRDGIFGAAREMYHDLSIETGKFIDMMLENDAFDVDSRENKWGGGYCTYLHKYRQPFILANFNGTSGDVDVITHEAGHAFADYMAGGNRFFTELGVGGMDTAETHSMSMEFFAWKYLGKFFGTNAEKSKFMHAFDAFSFIPYGTAVDYFQHIIYANPDMTPAERNETWKGLESQFRPYLSAEGITYLSKGTRWQYQMHIYESPFYYIDYCLAQAVAFEFLFESLKDYEGAFKKYVRFLSRGGEKLFADLIEEAGLVSPFKEGALESVAKNAEKLINGLRP
ncbi:MAG: Peptidase family M3 [Firmicutes bacterium ADurb.Bin182]|nr:MAG: Peptidase family M3 [Firmicutes bacterium ADurb.Bin182]